MKLYNINQNFIDAYRPQQNAPIERKNLDIMSRVRILCEESGRSWSDILPMVQMSINY